MKSKKDVFVKNGFHPKIKLFIDSFVNLTKKLEKNEKNQQ
jgi:hypothetical protein